jgi:hypothetical protein
VLAIELAIDKALSSAFGYGTTSYLRYNHAATLDSGALLGSAKLRAPVPRPIGASVRHDLDGQETSQDFSENKGRAIALLRQAIRTLEKEIANAEPGVVVSKNSTPSLPVIEPGQDAKPAPAVSRTTSNGRWRGIGDAVWRSVRQWWRGSKG